MANFTAGGTAEDQLAIRNEGNSAGQIGVAGTTVSFGGTTIGSFTGGTDGFTPLIISLNANADVAAVEALAPASPAPLPDVRIQRVIDRAAEHLDESLGRAAAAAGVYLSPSRLRHLFVEQTGLAYKTYLLWLRLIRALEVYAEGKSLTQAAHAAGFADSAHFSRTFKRTFGLPATTLERL